MAFLPRGPRRRPPRPLAARSRTIVAERGPAASLGWRDVPIDSSDDRGDGAAARCRRFRQLVPQPTRPALAGIDLDRRCSCARKRAEHELATTEGAVYFPSLSARTLVYKGMLTTPQLGDVLPRPRRRARRVGPGCWCTAASRRTRSRRGRWPTRTATSPTTARSTPSRATRTGCGPARRCCDDSTCPAASSAPSRSARHGASDTARFDEVLELLHLGGRPIRHAVLMMIPEAWENHADDGRPRKRAFYRFHSSLMEPWDGPASIAFTDGTVIGAVLDRNGLRPEPLLGHRRRPRGHGLRGRRRSTSTRPRSSRKGRLQPGRMFLVDTAQGRIVDDEEIKADARRRAPVRRVAPRRACVDLDDLPDREHVVYSHDSRAAPPAGVRLHRTRSSKIILAPMAADRRRADRLDGHRHADRRAVGAPAPAVRLLPAAVRPGHQPAARRHPRGARHRRLVDVIGPEGNLLRPSPRRCRQLELPFPIIDNDELAKLIHINDDGDLPGTCARTSSSTGLYRVAGGGGALRRRARRSLPRGARTAIADGARIIVLSDRDADAAMCADPVAAAHRRPCTTTSSARRPAPRSACSSSAATPARCTTWRC